MNAEQLDIIRIIFTIVFALTGIVLLVLGVKETESKKKKRGLTIFGGESLSFSIFAVSLLVKSTEIRDILTSIAVLSALVFQAFLIAFIIGDYRQKRNE
jgi:hypothetical protein